jgi:Tfp pilus assembly protein PilX
MKSPIPSFTTRHPVGAELIHADILLEATKQRTWFVSLPVAAWMYVRTIFSNMTMSKQNSKNISKCKAQQSSSPTYLI